MIVKKDGLNNDMIVCLRCQNEQGREVAAKILYHNEWLCKAHFDEKRERERAVYEFQLRG